MNEAERAFFEDVLERFDLKVENACDALTRPGTEEVMLDPEPFRRLQPLLEQRDKQTRAALKEVVSQILIGAFHTMLVTFDGGSALAEKFTLKITTSKKQTFGPGLHEKMMEHVFATKRMK